MYMIHHKKKQNRYDSLLALDNAVYFKDQFSKDKRQSECSKYT